MKPNQENKKAPSVNANQEQSGKQQAPPVPQQKAPPPAVQQKASAAEKPREDKGGAGRELEGEGSYTGSHNYREGVQRTIDKGGIEQAADAAAEAVDGPEGDELRQAEKDAKKGPRSLQS